MDSHKTCIEDHQAISFFLGKLHNFLLHLLATARTTFGSLYFWSLAWWLASMAWFAAMAARELSIVPLNTSHVSIAWKCQQAFRIMIGIVLPRRQLRLSTVCLAARTPWRQSTLDCGELMIAAANDFGKVCFSHSWSLLAMILTPEQDAIWNAMVRGAKPSDVFRTWIQDMLLAHVALTFDQRFDHTFERPDNRGRSCTCGNLLVGYKWYCLAKSDGCLTTFHLSFSNESLASMLESLPPQTIKLELILIGSCQRVKGKPFGQKAQTQKSTSLGRRGQHTQMSQAVGQNNVCWRAGGIFNKNERKDSSL